MALNSKIEWTEATWNPTTGCTKVSPGCKNCYAERDSNRYKKIPKQVKYRKGFELTVHEDTLEIPLHWRDPKIVFVNSMSDLFHEKIPLSFIKKTFDVMNKTGQHTYQVLTKREKRLSKLWSEFKWTKNIWAGVSVENQEYTSRIEYLREVPAAVRFLSIEPLLEPITELNLNGIDWVIVGGESGPRSRPIQADWVRVIRDICLEQKVPFFFKQWGGVHFDH